MKIYSTGFKLALILVCINVNVFSQDIITLRTGEELKVVVSEIEHNIIKYRIFENPAGPFYTLEKSEVYMIVYENGSREEFETLPDETQVQENVAGAVAKGSLAFRKPDAVMQNNELLSKDESRKILSTSPEALKSYDKGRKLIRTGTVLIGVSVVTSLGTTLLFKDPLSASYLSGFLFSTGAFTGYIVTTLNGKKKIKKAVNLYNSGLGK